MDKSRAFAIANSAKLTDADRRMQELRLRLTELQRQNRVRTEAKEEEMRGRMEELRARLAPEIEWRAGAEEREKRRQERIAASRRQEEERRREEEAEDDTEDLEYAAAQDRWYADLRERDLAKFAETEECKREMEGAFVDFDGMLIDRAGDVYWLEWRDEVKMEREGW